MKEDMKSAVALAHSRKCTKELLFGLPKFGSIETFGARAEKRNVLTKKTAADVLPCALLSGLSAKYISFFLWAVQLGKLLLLLLFSH